MALHGIKTKYLVVLSSLLLFSCGGGSNSSSPDDDNNSNNTPVELGEYDPDFNWLPTIDSIEDLEKIDRLDTFANSGLAYSISLTNGTSADFYLDTNMDVNRIELKNPTHPDMDILVQDNLITSASIENFNIEYSWNENILETIRATDVNGVANELDLTTEELLQKGGLQPSYLQRERENPTPREMQLSLPSTRSDREILLSPENVQCELAPLANFCQNLAPVGFPLGAAALGFRAPPLALPLLLCQTNHFVRANCERCIRNRCPLIIWGDPHVITLDGLAYDFQAIGEYQLLSSKIDNLEIQVRQEPWGSSRSVSVVTGVAFKVDDSKVSFIVNPDSGISDMYINDELTSIVDGVYDLNDNGSKIVVTDRKYKVVWANGSAAVVGDTGRYINVSTELQPIYNANIEGLVGNWDSDLRDDIQLRDGTDLGTTPTSTLLYGQYRSDWRVRDSNSLFTYRDGENSDAYYDSGFPVSIIDINSLSNEQIQFATPICEERGITNTILFNACLVDVGITRSPEFADSISNDSSPVISLDLDKENVIFLDTFDEEVALNGGTILNHVNFVNFDVEGDVDLIESGAFGIDCTGFSGGCVDLDGSGNSNPAGVLVSKNIEFEAGSYILKFNMSGNT